MSFSGYVTDLGIAKIYARLVSHDTDDEYDATIPIRVIPQKDRKIARTIGAIFTIDDDANITFSRRKWTQREIARIRQEADLLAEKLRGTDH